MSPPWVRDIRFHPAPRPLSQVNEVVLHATVGTTLEGAVRVLKTRKDRETGVLLKLSTHLIIDEHGVAHLTAEFDTRARHCGAHNGQSVGIDIVTPYYPKGGQAPAPWGRVIAAPWADDGADEVHDYVLPTLAQMSTLVDVLRYLTGPGGAIPCPATFVGAVGGRFRMGLLSDAAKLRPGIWSHQHAGTHADGSWPALVAYLAMEQGMAVEDAYETAARLATGARGWVTLPSPSMVLASTVCPTCHQPMPGVRFPGPHAAAAGGGVGIHREVVA